MHKLFRDWAGREESIELILEPSSLDDLGKKLETLGRERKISKLIFMGHGLSSAKGIHFLLGANELTINEQSFITLAQNRPKLSEAFLPGAHLMFFNCRIGRNKPFLRASGNAFLSTHGGFVIANTTLIGTGYAPDVDDDGNAILKWVESPNWWRWSWWRDYKGEIQKWFGEGWTTIEILKGHVQEVSPIIHGTLITINSSWGAGPTRCLTPTEEGVECNREHHWCLNQNNPCTKCPSGFFPARYEGVDKCVRCPNGMAYSQNDNRCQ